ncbi:WD40-repeat-containing domain protein [Gymnopilus junonius]|uniref:WD40-repeat-containing domain protein n=1 Tax=Gymnopilus junonius TaxID=109634 RepID=A0A9P5P546_GYMJU|nr:WD40-repeat-containing domain protein [Gymnopilus junonius]
MASSSKHPIQNKKNKSARRSHQPAYNATNVPQNLSQTPQYQTLYIPVESPPTPAPSPPSVDNGLPAIGPSDQQNSLASDNTAQDPAIRREYITSFLDSCSPEELLFISRTITPLLKRDFVSYLPPELALHVLSFIDEPRTLTRASRVSRNWYRIVRDETIWRRMCYIHEFDDWEAEAEALSERNRLRRKKPKDTHADGGQNAPDHRSHRDHSKSFSFRRHFRNSYIIRTNWRKGGELLSSHRLPIVSPDNGTVTSLALDSDWVVVGLASSMVKLFSAHTGVLCRTLIGHDSGVWGVCLVSKGGHRMPAPDGPIASGNIEGSDLLYREAGNNVQFNLGRPSSSLSEELSRLNLQKRHDGAHVMPSEFLEHLIPQAMQKALGLDILEGIDSSNAERDSGQSMSASSRGWGQPNSIVVSGGCDKTLRVWDAKSGQCIYIMHGHTATIRCMRMLHNRPIALTGSRDSTLRVWDVQLGRCLRVLEGHDQSVRCLDVCGNKVVSGSYDSTCRLWNIDTGECLHVLVGHLHQVYCVAFDGEIIASGGLDTTVRLWDAETGQCIALLQGHTALVCQLQLSSATGILATGGSDGRVITFSLKNYQPLHLIAAHDSSVTTLQFDKDFLVTGGNDGRVRLYETQTGNFVREMSEPSQSVWQVAFIKDLCAVMCKRAGKTVVEIWSLRPTKGKKTRKSRKIAQAEGRVEVIPGSSSKWS